MEENKVLQTNSFKIVGKLVDAKVTEGARSNDGQAYVSVVATVRSTLNGVVNEYEINFYSLQMTLEGKVSQLYTNYCKMADLVNKKVEITGSLRENRYFSTNLNQVVSAQQLSGRFIRGVVESTQDEASYVIGGFVVTGLTEKRNKDDEVYRYDLAIGQQNYKGDNMNKFVVHFRPEDRDAVSFAESYEVGATIQINGTLNFLVEEVVRQDNNEGGFGKGVTRTYTNRQRNFWVEGGSAQLEENAYPIDLIKKLINAYKAADVELANAAKEQAPAKGASLQNNAPAQNVSKRQTSLI